MSYLLEKSIFGENFKNILLISAWEDNGDICEISDFKLGLSIRVINESEEGIIRPIAHEFAVFQ